MWLVRRDITSMIEHITKKIVDPSTNHKARQPLPNRYLHQPINPWKQATQAPSCKKETLPNASPPGQKTIRPGLLILLLILLRLRLRKPG